GCLHRLDVAADRRSAQALARRKFADADTRLLGDSGEQQALDRRNAEIRRIALAPEPPVEPVERRAQLIRDGEAIVGKRAVYGHGWSIYIGRLPIYMG